MCITDDVKGTPIENCTKPNQSGKGYWIDEDRYFGYGLNVPRTRHASEIIKTKVKLIFTKFREIDFYAPEIT